MNLFQPRVLPLTAAKVRFPLTAVCFSSLSRWSLSTTGKAFSRLRPGAFFFSHRQLHLAAQAPAATARPPLRAWRAPTPL